MASAPVAPAPASAIDARPLPAQPNLGQYKTRAKELLAAARHGDAAAIRRIAQCPRVRAAATDAPDSARAAALYALADAQYVIAREHGFDSWPVFAHHLRDLHSGPVRAFEEAVDAVVAGDLAALGRGLEADPSLAHAQSTRVHHATLLHYVAANGVENYRQRTPPNAVDVARMLLDSGACVDAVAQVYGGETTTMDLLVSSGHPAHAGLQVPLVHALLDAGAAINGLRDNGSPLMTAVAFHYPDAAAALVERGARVDNIVVVAALGLVDRVDEYLAGPESRLAGRAEIGLRWPRLPRDAKGLRELALNWAAAYGRSAVVERLLRYGVDLRATESQGFTPLHSAAFYGHADTVDLLIRAGAPLEVENVYHGTVLGQTIWAVANARLPVDYVPVVERLLAAGARVDPGWGPSGDARVDALLHERLRAESSRARPS
jgi:hypothetical protein